MKQVWHSCFASLCLIGAVAICATAQEWPLNDNYTGLDTDLIDFIETKEEPVSNDSSEEEVIEPPDRMAVGAPPGPGVETSKRRRLQAEQEAEDKERQDAINAAKKEEGLKNMLAARRAREIENWHKRNSGLTDEQIAERDGLTGHSQSDPDPSDLTDGWYNGEYLGEEGASEAASEGRTLATVRAQQAAQEALAEKARRLAEIKAHNEWEDEQDQKLKEEHAKMDAKKRLEKEQALTEAQEKARQKYLEREDREEKARAAEEAKREAAEARHKSQNGAGADNSASTEENSLLSGWVNGQPVDPSQIGQAGEMTMAQQEAAAKKAALAAAAAKKADQEAEIQRKLKAEAMNKKLTASIEDPEAVKKRKADEDFAKLQQETTQKAAQQRARDARAAEVARQEAQKKASAAGVAGPEGRDMSNEDVKALLGGWVNGQLMDPSQAQQVGEMTMKQQEAAAKKAALAAVAAKKADQKAEIQRKLKAEAMNKAAKTAEQLSKEAEKKKLDDAFSKLQEDMKKKSTSELRKSQELAEQKKLQEQQDVANAQSQGSQASESGPSGKDVENMVGGWVNGEPVGAEGAAQAAQLSAEQQAAVAKLAAQAQAQAKEEAKQAELRRKQISELMNENGKKESDARDAAAAAKAKSEKQRRAQEGKDQESIAAKQKKLQELLHQQQASFEVNKAQQQQQAQQSLTQEQMAMQSKLMEQQRALAGINAFNQMAYRNMLYGSGGMYGGNHPFFSGAGVLYDAPDFSYLYNSLNVPNPAENRWQPKKLPQRTLHAAYGHGSNFMTGVVNPMNAGGLNNAYIPPVSPSRMGPTVDMGPPSFNDLYNSLNVPNPAENRWQPKVVQQRIPHATYGQDGNFMVGTQGYSANQYNMGSQSQLGYQPPSANMGDSNPNFDTVSDEKGVPTPQDVPQRILQSVSGVDNAMVDPYAQ